MQVVIEVFKGDEVIARECGVRKRAGLGREQEQAKEEEPLKEKKKQHPVNALPGM